MLNIFNVFNVTEAPVVELDVAVRNGVIIKAGESLKLPAFVAGRPQPEVAWTKDDAEPDKERVVIDTAGKSSVLFIKHAVRTDFGTYTITGKNSSGTKSASVKVDVMGMFFLIMIAVATLHLF